MSVDTLLNFLSDHQPLTLGILFLASYFETVIISSFLIYGEIFFLAGAILAGIGTASLWQVSLVLYVGGILGDHSSYWIGRRYGQRFYTAMTSVFFLKRYFTEKNYAQGEKFFVKFGGWSVFMGRFLGPVSWITPFLAGTFKLDYRKFTLFDFPAVILGIGQFIVVGYLFGKSYQTILNIVQQYLIIGIFVSLAVIGIIYYFRKLLQRFGLSLKYALIHFFTQLRQGNRSHLQQVLKASLSILAIAVIVYIIFLLIIFFVGNQKLSGKITSDFNYTFTNHTEIVQKIDSSLYYENGTKDVQPINVVMVTVNSIDEILLQSGWKRVNTFLRNNISFNNYFEQMEDGLLPISDLYFDTVPQNLAYEYASSTTILNRQHIRLWNLGTYNDSLVYIISASQDVGIDLYRDLSFIVPYHSINPNVDDARDFFTQSITQAYPGTTLTIEKSILGPRSRKHSEDSTYYSDGELSFITINR